MKHIILAIIAAIFLAGCTTRTDYGECIGIANDKDPALHYKISVLNTVLGVLFIETVIVPVVVLADNIYCPVGRKDSK